MFKESVGSTFFLFLSKRYINETFLLNFREQIAIVQARENVTLIIVAVFCKCGIAEYIAAQVPEVTIAIEGDCQKLFYNGDRAPDFNKEIIQSKYPLVVEKFVNGYKKKALVVNSFVYGKYYGKLYVKLKKDEDEIDSFSGNSYLLDNKYYADKNLAYILEKSEKYFNESSFNSNIDYDQLCDGLICPYGRFLTESLVAGRMLQVKGITPTVFTDPVIAFISRGSVKDSQLMRIPQQIFLESISNTAYKSRFYVVQVKGSTIKKSMEIVSKIYVKNQQIILQVYGIKGQVDSRGEDTQLELLVSQNRGLNYEVLNEFGLYNIIIENTLYNGTYKDTFGLNFIDENVEAPIPYIVNKNTSDLDLFSEDAFFYNIMDEQLKYFKSIGNISLVNSLSLVLLLILHF